MEFNINLKSIIFLIVLVFGIIRAQPVNIDADLFLEDEEASGDREGDDVDFEDVVSTTTEFSLPSVTEQPILGHDSKILFKPILNRFHSNKYGAVLRNFTGNWNPLAMNNFTGGVNMTDNEESRTMTPIEISSIGLPGYRDGGNVHFEPFSPERPRLPSQTRQNSIRSQSVQNSFTPYRPQPQLIIPDIPNQRSYSNSYLLNQAPQTVIENGNLNLLLRSQFQKYDSNFNKVNAKLKQSRKDLENSNNRISKVDLDAKELTRLSNENVKEEFAKVMTHVNQLNTKIEDVKNYSVASKYNTDRDMKTAFAHIKQLYNKINDQEARFMNLIRTLNSMSTNPLPNGITGPAV